MLEKFIRRLFKKNLIKIGINQDIFKKLEILQLEERVTPASLAGFNKFQPLDETLKQAIFHGGSNLVPATTRQDVVIIDSNLIATIPQQELRGSLIVPIDGNRDAIQQISNALKNVSGIDTLRVISHGSDGALWFGSQKITSSELHSRASEFAAWGKSLSKDGDILLYGCSVASSGLGQSFVSEFANQTGADVAASTNKTGLG